MTAPTQLGESINRMLECPVCFNQMEPPIEMCKNGHNLCSGCKPKLSQCPICSGEFTSVRNRTLESLTDNFLYSCSNHQLGCPVKCIKADRNKHLQMCKYRGYECLPYKNTGCQWKGQLADLYTHMTTHHKNCAVFKEFPVKIHFLTHVAISAVRLAKIKDDLFWVHLRQDPDNSKYFRAVQYIGEVENASKYEYKYELDLRDGTGTGISYKRKVYSEDDDMDEEYKNNGTMTHLLNLIKECGHERNSIICNFSIHKVEGNC